MRMTAFVSLVLLGLFFAGTARAAEAVDFLQQNLSTQGPATSCLNLLPFGTYTSSIEASALDLHIPPDSRGSVDIKVLDDQGNQFFTRSFMLSQPRPNPFSARVSLGGPWVTTTLGIPPPLPNCQVDQDDDNAFHMSCGLLNRAGTVVWEVNVRDVIYVFILASNTRKLLACQSCTGNGRVTLAFPLSF